ncbi:hypothetical protein EDD22DRAFT_1005788 [Suillus occidentalis]|nr:hypothetical protein EDD22DRAFT_1005788 [Suillus occidentalis]
MDQYSILFGTARIPTERSCKMLVNDAARHTVVLRRGQFYWSDALDEEYQPLSTEREILRNLQVICKDAVKTPITEVARTAIDVLITENRKIWSSLRHELAEDKTNAACLRLVDDALLVVCLDDAAPGRDGVGALARNGEKGEDLAALCSNFLCGTYDLQEGVQVGTCTNRWYDKLQIIVCADGAAGINFEHTGVDDHVVLRFTADVFTEGLMLLAQSLRTHVIPHIPFSACQILQTSQVDGKRQFARRTECTYGPAMTKAFLHGRTAIRTVQPESIDFTKTFFLECLPHDKIRRLHKACE